MSAIFTLGVAILQPKALLRLLDRVEPERLYLVGDVVDGWRLSRQWYWEESYYQLLEALWRLSRQGTEVVVVAGNHDAFLRRYQGKWGPWRLVDDYIHETADGRRLLVAHGDQFDFTQQAWPGLARVAGDLHEWLLWLDACQNRFATSCGFPIGRWNTRITGFLHRRFHHEREFFRRALAAAREKECDGIVCGHLHQPRLVRTQEGDIYANTGDWINHCSALVESSKGDLRLWHSTPLLWQRGVFTEFPVIGPPQEQAEWDSSPVVASLELVSFEQEGVMGT